jgi:hypothetical protein
MHFTLISYFTAIWYFFFFLYSTETILQLFTRSIKHRVAAPYSFAVTYHVNGLGAPRVKSWITCVLKHPLTKFSYAPNDCLYKLRCDDARYNSQTKHSISTKWLVSTLKCKMYPNPQSLQQFYPSQSRTTYPYPFYFQQNHPMNFTSPPSPTSTQKATATVTYDEIFTNALSPIPPMPPLPSKLDFKATQARFQGE